LSPEQLAAMPVFPESEYLEDYGGPVPDVSGNVVIGWFER
jgi:hypothetical protein